MNNQYFQYYSQESPQKRKQLKMSTKSNFDNNGQNDWSQPEFKINVYNYFLDDFPKTYQISKNDTIENLKQMIANNTSNIKIEDIKNFKDENGSFVKNNTRLSKFYKNNCKLNMEIYFNQNLKITTNNKQIQYFMSENNSNSFNEIFKSIINFHKNVKGGKVIVGVQPDGLIKGINIPEQDQYKDDFLNQFRASNLLPSNILKDVEISFFRVKGQSKVQYNYHDHKKIMIIKVKGTNKQEDNSQDSTDDNEETNETSPVLSFTENLNSLSPNNLSINEFAVKQKQQFHTETQQTYNLFNHSVSIDFIESLFKD